MPQHDHEYHARAFVRWYLKLDRGDWACAFRQYAGHLQEEDRQAVRRLAEAELIARGVLVPSPDYEPPEIEVLDG